MSGAATIRIGAAASAYCGRSSPEPIGLGDLLNSGLWAALPFNEMYDFQTTIFQPVGGMGQVGQTFGREAGSR